MVAKDEAAGPELALALPARARRPSRAERSRWRLVEGPLGREIGRFGLPLVVGMVLHTSFNLIDMFMISRLENATAALAALGMCDMVAAVATILSNGISTAAVAIIARRVGANDLAGIRRGTYQSLLFIALLSVAFGLLGVFGSDVVVRKVMQAKGEAADLAVGYLQIILGGCFSIFFLLQLTAILRALGHAKTAASLLIGGNVLNILLNVLLIYGPGPHPPIFAWAAPVAEALGIPRLGVEGAAWATLIGRTVPVVIGAILLVRRKAGPRFHPHYLRPDRRELGTLLRIGWPSSAQLVLRVGAILVFISLVSANYTTAGDQSALSAYGICLRLETMALFVGMGWGAAASSFTAVALGSGNLARARASGWVASAYNLAMMLGLTYIYLAHGEAVVAFFDPSPLVVAVGREYLGTVALSYALVGVALVLSQAMQGAGATMSSMLLDAFFLLALVVPAAYVVTETLALPRQALWLTLAIGNGVAAVGYVLWYARGSFFGRQH